MKWYWIMIIVMAALVLGFWLQLYGENCRGCQRRKKKWFGKKESESEKDKWIKNCLLGYEPAPSFSTTQGYDAWRADKEKHCESQYYKYGI